MKIMKTRLFTRITAIGLIALTLSSCATLFGGRITESQKRKPGPGEPQREIRVAALVADILIFLPSVIVDFADAAIYRPQPANTK